MKIWVRSEEMYDSNIKHFSPSVGTTPTRSEFTMEESPYRELSLDDLFFKLDDLLRNSNCVFDENQIELIREEILRR